MKPVILKKIIEFIISLIYSLFIVLIIRHLLTYLLNIDVNEFNWALYFALEKILEELFPKPHVKIKHHVDRLIFVGIGLPQ